MLQSFLFFMYGLPILVIFVKTRDEMNLVHDSDIKTQMYYPCLVPTHLKPSF